MACDFSIAADTAIFGQAGPRHGSAPDGGSTDFLPLYVGFAPAMESCTLCEMWSAHHAHRIGLINDLAPVLKEDGNWIANPRVITDRWIEDGTLVYGTSKRGAALEAAKARIASCEVDMSQLDVKIESLAWKLANTVPDCLTKTIESLRKHKLEHWHKNRESNRAWLALNMVTEAKAGFRAFHYGQRGQRQIDFLELRRRLAAGEDWSDELIAAVSPHQQSEAADTTDSDDTAPDEPRAQRQPRTAEV